MTRPAGLRRALGAPLLFLLLLCASASALVPVPPLTGHVVDKVGALPAGAREALESDLTALEDRKGSQAAVLIIPTTDGEAIEAFALRVAEQWKLGRKKVDDGVILVVALEDRAMRLEVGYGLEGALSDIICKRIITDIITPHFKQGDIPGGLQAGVAAVIKVIDGEPLPEPARTGQGRQRARSPGGNPGAGPVILIVLAMAVGAALRTALGRLGGGVVTGGLVGVVGSLVLGSMILGIVAAIAAFLFVLLGRHSVGGMGGFGGFGGGRGGGGGFGGFSGGGGSFGGGGASGRW